MKTNFLQNRTFYSDVSFIVRYRPFHRIEPFILFTSKTQS